MTRLHVAVLRGGPSNEYDVSLKTGHSVIKALQEKYKVSDIFISKDGTWHMNGVPRKPADILKHVDVVFNALHGHFGEDGKVQHILDTLKVPYTGSEPFASSVAMNKAISKDVFKKAGIKTPYFAEVKYEENLFDLALKVFKMVPLPVIVKPTNSGSSIGISIVRDFYSLEEALKKAFEHGESVVVEEYIKGREVTCGVIEDFRDHKSYPLLPVEIKHGSDMLTYDHKLDENIEHTYSDAISAEESKMLQQIAKAAHEAVGARHYSRSDFIIHPQRGIYLLETNTLPGLHENSSFVQSLKTIGSTLHHFLDHVIALALKRK